MNLKRKNNTKKKIYLTSITFKKCYPSQNTSVLEANVHVSTCILGFNINSRHTSCLGQTSMSQPVSSSAYGNLFYVIIETVQ